MNKQTTTVSTQKASTFIQFIKFCVVGAANTLIDWGVLFGLMSLTGFTSGMYYSVQKGFSFIVAVINSYIFNKFWTFKAKEKERVASEFSQFMIVSVVGLIINVTIASLVVNYIAPFSLAGRIALFMNISQDKLWGIFGAGVATIIALLWNFIGYKFWVFKK